MSVRKTLDLTHPPDLTEHGAGTGPMRRRRPVYVDFLPPCNQACPAGENIQAWLAEAQAGRYERAWRILMQDNPLPAVHGRVCYHPCETHCNRNAVDGAVNIHAIERFLGDLALQEGWQVAKEKPPTGKRVLVIGAGPSGLSAAYHLSRLGHAVEIYEAGPMAGGMMQFGIPAYRLPREAMQQEVRRIEAMGVRICLNHKVQDLLQEKETGRFDAVFLAIGAHLSKRIDVPARDAGKILDALSFLRQAATGESPRLGRRVAIYGGGNTAVDAARTAKRLGAEEALIIYRRDPAHMPAHPSEVEEALEEGIKVRWLRSIKSIEQTHLQVEVMRLDEQGYPIPTGQYETLEADALILALGQETDAGFLRGVPGIRLREDGTVVVDAHWMTGHPGIFAGGDMVPGERTVTASVGHGKKAARYIDAYLRGEHYVAPPKHPTVGFEKLRVWYLIEVDPRAQSRLDPLTRNYGFAEVVQGLSEAETIYEARRCFSCGNCFECEGCYAACPEQAIIKLGPGRRYRFDYAQCTGCAVCYEQCPCHAIEMFPEPKPPAT